MMEIHKLIICNSPGLKCKDVEFIQESFFDLMPGSFVSQIGDGRENGCVRTDELTLPHKYSGALVIDQIKVFAFLIPDQLIRSVVFDSKELEYKYYLLYERTNEEIARHTDIGKHAYSVRFYVPEFKIVQNSEIENYNRKGLQLSLF